MLNIKSVALLRILFEVKVLKILFIGDIVGRCGIDSAFENVYDLREKYSIDFCIANCENAAGGFGITREILEDLKRAGVDAFTGGNHIFSQKNDLEVFSDNEFDIARPYNLPGGNPGKGAIVVATKCGKKVGIINLLGNLYMNCGDENVFESADKAIAEIKDRADIIILDVHAEATSEKKALGYYLDGKATAVFGTHTHIQTADEEIFKNGTAYITDAGMCGAKNSVLGAEIKTAIAKFISKDKVHYKGADGEKIFCGVIIDVDDNGRNIGIKRIRI